MRNNKQEALASVAKLEKLAKEHLHTGKTLQALAGALRKVMAEVKAHAEAIEGKGSLPARKKGHSQKPVIVKRKKLSKAARQRISETMKARWQERKQKAA